MGGWAWLAYRGHQLIGIGKTRRDAEQLCLSDSKGGPLDWRTVPPWPGLQPVGFKGVPFEKMERHQAKVGRRTYRIERRPITTYGWEEDLRRQRV